MLSKVYEWLRAADLKPDDAMVTSRTKAVEDFEKKIRDSSSYDLVLGTVTAAVGGCERVGESSSTYSTLLSCVRTQSPAFSSSIAENGLHLRVVCCLALGQLLSSNEDEASYDELLAATLFISGVGLKPKEAGRHLDKVLDELKSIARTSLQKQAVAQREREDLEWSDLDALKDLVGEPPTYHKKLTSALKRLLQGLEQQAKSDREELEVMWWLYNGYSDRLGMQVKSANPFLAAAAIGCELANRITPPAMSGLNELVKQSALRDRSQTQLKAKPIAKISAELDEQGQQLLVPSEESIRKFIRSTGVLLPLSWLCLRLHENRGASGWEGEFRSQTGLASTHALAPDDLALQIFAERHAQRVYQSIVKETS